MGRRQITDDDPDQTCRQYHRLRLGQVDKFLNHHKGIGDYENRDSQKTEGITCQPHVVGTI